MNMLVRGTRLRSKREYLKMRTVMSGLPKPMKTTLEGTLLASPFIFSRFFCFFKCTAVPFKKGALQKKKNTPDKTSYVSTQFTGCFVRAVSQEGSLSHKPLVR